MLPVGIIDRVATGYSPSNGPDRVLANWVIMVLPHLEQDGVYKGFNQSLPVDDSANGDARSTNLPFMLCPTDAYNQKPYQRALLAGTGSGHTYARGNYAINAGPDNGCIMGRPGCNNGFYVDNLDLLHTNMRVWGTGMAGVNTSFRMRDFPKGASRFAALDEIRAGIDPIDPRGVWALGMPGASFTVRHGIYNLGDTSPPNSRSPVSDDIVGCAALQAKYGLPQLISMGMPCQVNSPESNKQATSRSMHPLGVHVLMLDGSAHFVAENINPQVWYDMHSKDSAGPSELPFDD